MALTRFRNHQLRDFDYKNSVRAATTTNIASLSGGAPNSVDSVTLAKGDRILVKDQSTGSQNGIYEVTTLGTGSNGTWSRAADANTSTGILNSGATVFVSEGTASAGKIYRLLTADPITVGTTSQTWSAGSASTPAGSNTEIQFNSSGAMASSSNLTWNGSLLSATLIKSSQSSGDEGGQIDLAAPAANTTISSGVAIDLYQDKFRIFETGGSNRGFYITMTKGASSANTDLVSTIVNGNSNVVVYPNSNVTISSTGTANVLTVTSTGANIAGTANITGAVALGSSLTVTGATNLGSVSNVTITGGSSGQYLQTNGSGGLSWQTLSSNSISNGNSNVSVAANSNVTISAVGQANVFTVTNTGANISGTINATGNANVGNLGTAGQFVSTIATGTAPFVVTSTTQVANLNVATAGSATSATSATTAGTVTTAAQPNITSVGTLTGLTSSSQVLIAYDGAADTGTVNNTSMLEIKDTGATSQPSLTFHRPSAWATKIVLDTDNKLYFGGWSAAVGGQAIVCGNITPGANVTYGLGTSSLRWTTIYGTSTSAQYADLAERYLADIDYPVGTVLKIGGAAEVTVAEKGNVGVVGTVSENPGFLMNDTLEGDYLTSVAYIGRVPCRVQGDIKRGDLLVVGDTAGVATAVAAADLIPGTLVGKALQAYNNSEEGIIEILVGRL